ncbi:hypothetical protein RND71_038033 [Anisodus tanguticus]|uniref:Uncharacterized protein n=1 Tax=Anisodus tanguticus TaxID=243964 RepID=A0AAE1UT55_9SOLA|nr:hypothetical protein RND71_038033 [Anisodus tanguticus]
MLKKGVFGYFRELSDLHLFDNILHYLVLSQIVSSNDNVLKFKVFDREVIFDRECFHLITGLDFCVGDFSVVSIRTNKLLNRYFPNEERIKLSDLRRFLQFHSSRCACGYWERYSDVVRPDEVYIVERVLLGRDEGFVSGVKKQLDDERSAIVIQITEINYQGLHSQLIGDVNLSIVEATTVDIPVLNGVSCKRRRCDDGKKDDDDLPRWDFITPEDSVFEKRTNCGTEIYYSDDESEDEITSLEDRVKYDESINVAAETEQVSQETAFSTDGEDPIEGVAHENVDCATVVDEQEIVNTIFMLPTVITWIYSQSVFRR